MAKRPSFQFYHRDFLADDKVQLMTCEEVGAYLLLLIHQWTAGHVPSEVEHWARVCRVTPGRMRMMAERLEPCFPVGTDGQRRNPRMETVRAERDSFCSEQRERANRRWQQSGNAMAMPTHQSGINAASVRHDSGNAEVVPESCSASATAKNYQPTAASSTPLPPKRKKPEIEPFPLPDWLPQEAWFDFVAMRLAIRKPLKTAGMVKRCIATLDKLRLENHDPQAVLDQSIASGWAGLFPVHDQQNGGRNALTVAEQNRRNAAIALERHEARVASDRDAVGVTAAGE